MVATLGANMRRPSLWTWKDDVIAIVLICIAALAIYFIVRNIT